MISLARRAGALKGASQVGAFPIAIGPCLRKTQQNRQQAFGQMAMRGISDWIACKKACLSDLSLVVLIFKSHLGEVSGPKRYTHILVLVVTTALVDGSSLWARRRWHSALDHLIAAAAIHGHCLSETDGGVDCCCERGRCGDGIGGCSHFGGGSRASAVLFYNPR